MIPVVLVSNFLTHMVEKYSVGDEPGLCQKIKIRNFKEKNMELNRGLCSILLTSLHTVQTLQTETLSFVLSSSIFLSRLSPTVRLRLVRKIAGSFPMSRLY